MEWRKSDISMSELERKQKEFMEEAVRMAKKAGYSAPEPKPEPVITPEPVIHEPKEKTDEAEEIQTEPAAVAEETPCDIPEEKEEENTFGVFDKEELTKAIESGEISGEGLRQAAEILAEMSDKTEAMKKLIEKQEEDMKIPSDGGDYGLNSYIDRHNNKCRGCKNGRVDVP